MLVVPPWMRALQLLSIAAVIVSVRIWHQDVIHRTVALWVLLFLFRSRQQQMRFRLSLLSPAP